MFMQVGRRLFFSCLFFFSSSLDEHKNGQLGGKRGNKLIFLSYSEAHAD
jgi:hypothetical protein